MGCIKWRGGEGTPVCRSESAQQGDNKEDGEGEEDDPAAYLLHKTSRQPDENSARRDQRPRGPRAWLKVPSNFSRAR
eukprot:756297-Hanusia_phi.AAC.3